MKILVADDQADTAEFIRRGLTQAGHIVATVGTGTEALFRAMEETFDAIVLDRMLPEKDGLSVLKMLRAGGNRTPVILLTAMGGISDRVEGLESGADDYLTKPFALSELSARLNVIMRRPAVVEVETALRVGDIELDLRKRTVQRGGKRVDLQPREVLMLEELMRNVHRIMTKAMLLERVWDFDFDPHTNIVETHISRLRAKLNAGFEDDAIITVRGAGYMIRTP
ncbi:MULTISPECIES: response regulator transcription factor [Asticcacaulis]|uniref:response regulator transcription factor n=1 Tax=Asticcacaulis TaxID=76890 RepID=UPI001AE923A9|nr:MULTISPECIES: response regulator transcription factor [Asticcacaulis]MBP2160424.1 two-component system OmpR family response regulator [Asticcacaulis solisilvae]MDR6801469.1 two-component system OmpR family response regulator [Asticcacaulis sp. BE141]